MKTVLVTGATRDVGRTIAIALAQAGWRVIALGRARHELERLRADYAIIPMAADLTDRNEMRAVLADLRLDAVVHAALRWPAPCAFTQLAEADIDMGVEVNISAALHLTRMLVPEMVQNGRGAVLFVDDGDPAPLCRAAAGLTHAFATALNDETNAFGVRAGFLPAVPPNDARIVQTLEALLHSRTDDGADAGQLL